MSLLERVYGFHQEVAAGRFPNATTIVEQFEVSLATARRDIAYLRDRLLAPLVFDPAENGYRYSDEGFTLPFTDSPKILFLLAMLSKLAEEAGLKDLPEVQQLGRRLSSLLTTDYPALDNSLYCEWIEVESIDSTIFTTIIEAVVSRLALAIDYTATGNRESSRIVEPQRLCCYQGRWYLLAFCRLRSDLRMFHLARISAAQVRRESVTTIPDLEATYLEPAFGIFKGHHTVNAEILFTGTAAELVKRQRWHRHQSITDTTGGIILRLPVSEQRELATKILQYGSMAKVLAPPELQQAIASEARAMALIYGEN